MKSFKRIGNRRTYYVNPKGGLHREDGPAVIWENGREEWWINNKRHREDGPAIYENEHNYEYYRKGKRHRLDGPATCFTNHYRGLRFTSCKYYINGLEINENDFNNEILKLRLNRLKEL